MISQFQSSIKRMWNLSCSTSFHAFKSFLFVWFNMKKHEVTQSIVLPQKLCIFLQNFPALTFPKFFGQIWFDNNFLEDKINRKSKHETYLYFYVPTNDWALKSPIYSFWKKQITHSSSLATKILNKNQQDLQQFNSLTT